MEEKKKTQVDFNSGSREPVGNKGRLCPQAKRRASTHHPRRAWGTGRKDADGHDLVLKDPQGWDLSHPGSSRPDAYLQVLKTQPQQ